MKAFAVINVISNICIFHIFAKIEFREDTHIVQESSSNCALSIAKYHFEESSIIAIVTSGLQNVTNKNVAKSTYNLIMEKMMREMRWNIMIKIGTTYSGEQKVNRSSFKRD